MTDKAIYCKKQEEWDFVLEKIKWSTTLKFKERSDSGGFCDCIYLNKSWSSLAYAKQQGVKIYSFEDWCKLNNYDNPFEVKEEKIKFEIGKWYTCSCNTNLYQFNGFHENGKWGSSAVININNNYTYDGAEPGYTKRISHSHCAEYFSPSSLADMEVVNEFLPEVHKTLTIDDLVKGEIYTADNGVIFMYDSGDSAYYYLGELNMCFRKNGGRFYGEFKPATPEQKQWLNACIKADKFISKEKALKANFKSRVRWKVGDKLEFIQGKTYYYDKDGKELDSVTLKGSSYKVGEISTIHPDLFRFLVDEDIWYMESDFKLVKKEDTKSDQLLEEAKKRYPVGTRYVGIRYGKIQTVNFSPRLLDNKNIEVGFDYVYFEGKWAEIVTDDKTDKEVLPIPKFKKGDRVKVVKSLKDGWFQRKYQTISGVINYKGTIESIEYKEKGIYYVLDSLKPGLVLEDALELIETKKDVKNESKSLRDYVGRYLKALINKPAGGFVKKGEYGLIKDNDQVDFPSQKGYLCCNALREPTKYQLMPEGFTPEKDNNLVEGEYYVAEFTDSPEWNSIFISGGGLKLKYRLYINDKYTSSDKFNKSANSIWSKDYTINFRKASSSEKQWLDKCIENNKFVPETSVKEKAVIIPESDKVYMYDLGAVKTKPLREKESYKFKKNDLYKVNLGLY